jgi:DNA-binding response OmpR family regulator
MNKLLLIEDEYDLAYAIRMFLKAEGYEVDMARSYEGALQHIGQGYFDICLVDINLPDGDGNSLLPVLKMRHRDAGIIIISANDLTKDKVKALDFGADDYLVKPFDLQELNARIRSVLRRKNKTTGNKIVSGAIHLLPHEYKSFVDSNELTLTRKEFELLLYFITNQGHLITKETLAAHLWDIRPGAYDNYDFIYTHVKNLRRKLLAAGSPERIKNMHGIGYVFTEA